MSIPPVGPPVPPPAPPPPGPSTPPSLETADFYSSSRQIGTTIDVHTLLTKGTPMSLMDFVGIITENNQGFNQENSLSDLLDSFIDGAFKLTGLSAALYLSQLLDNVEATLAPTAAVSASQSTQVGITNPAIDAYNAGLPAEIAAVDALNQAITNYNDSGSVDYGNQAVLDAAVVTYNAYVATRSGDINTYNAAINAYNAQVTIDNASIDSINIQRAATGLPLLPYGTFLPLRDPMEAPPQQVMGNYGAPGTISLLASRNPDPGGTNQVPSLPPSSPQSQGAILVDLYDPLANPVLENLNQQTLAWRYSDEYRALIKKKLHITSKEPNAIADTATSTPAAAGTGALGGGGLMTLGSNPASPNLQNIVSTQLLNAATIGQRLDAATNDNLELLSRIFLTGTTLYAATGPALAAIGNSLGQSTLSGTAINVALAQAVAQSIGTAVGSGVLNPSILQVLESDPAFQALSPDQKLAVTNNVTAAINLSLLGLGFNQLGFALGAPGLPGQLLGSAAAEAGVSGAIAAGVPADLTQIGDALTAQLLGAGVSPGVATLSVTQLLALIQADPSLAGATGLNTLAGLLSLALQANGISSKEANALAGTVLLNVLGTTALTSPEQAVQQGISKTLMRTLFLPRDTAMMISAGIPTGWILPLGGVQSAVATGTVTVLGTSVDSGQALASAGAAVGIAIRTPGALDSERALKKAIANGLMTSLGISAAQADAIVAEINLKDLINKNALESSLIREFERNGADLKRAAVMAQVVSNDILADENTRSIVIDDQLQADLLEGNVINERLTADYVEKEAVKASQIKRNQAASDRVADLIGRSQIADDSIDNIEQSSERITDNREALALLSSVEGQPPAVVAAVIAAATLPAGSPLLDITKTELLDREELASQLATLIENQLSAALGSSKALLIAQAFIAELYGRERRDKDERDNPVSLLNLTKDQIRTLVEHHDVDSYRAFIEERVHDFVKENTMLDYGAYLKARLLNINGMAFLDTIHEAMSSQSGGSNSLAKKSTDILV